MTKKTVQLTGRQNKYLKGLGHHLPVVAMVGREGISKSVLTAIEEVLRAHELVKIRMQNNCPFDREEVAQRLSEESGAIIVQVIGKTILLYRENDDPQREEKIRLP
jgi:RNA-binding protein